MCFVFAKEKQEADDGPLQQGPAGVQESGTDGQESREGNEKCCVTWGSPEAQEQPSETAAHRRLLCCVELGQALKSWRAVAHLSPAELLHRSTRSRCVCLGFVHITRVTGVEAREGLRPGGPQQPLRLGDALSSAPRRGARRMASVTQKGVASKPRLFFCLTHQVPESPGCPSTQQKIVCSPKPLPRGLSTCVWVKMVKTRLSQGWTRTCLLR